MPGGGGQRQSSPSLRDLCKTIGFPPLTGEMSEGQRGMLRDDHAENTTDKNFAKVSLMERDRRENYDGDVLPSPLTTERRPAAKTAAPIIMRISNALVGGTCPPVSGSKPSSVQNGKPTNCKS